MARLARRARRARDHAAGRADAAPDARTVARLRAAGCVFAEEEAGLLSEAAATGAELASLLSRRVAGEPLEHVLGWAGFCGLRVTVGPGVFVPRRRSELLVAVAVAAARSTAGARRSAVVDLCCGCGAVGVAVAAALERAGRDAALHAVDVDPGVSHAARGNLARVGGRLHVGDLYGPLPDALRGRVDVVVANAPYVPTEQIPLLPAEARRHEPRVALDGGPDGLDLHRRIADAAPAWLSPGGVLVVETSESQVAGTVRAVGGAGLAPRVARWDEAGATAVLGTLAR